MLNKKNLIRIVINTLIGVILIFLWLKLVDIEEVLHVLSEANLIVIFPFVLLFITATILRSLRLKILLSDYQIPLKNLVPLTFLSQFLSFLIPLRVGEVSKAVYLSSEYQIPFSKSIIWIFLDRFLDFWLLLILVFGLLMLVTTNFPQQMIGLLLLSLFVFSTAGTLALFTPGLTKKLVKIFSNLLVFGFLKKHFTNISQFVLDTTSLLKKGKLTTFLILALTFGALLAEGVMWYVLFLGLAPALNFLLIWLGSLLSALTYLVPAAPGYVGSAEAAGLAVFTFILGLDKTIVSAATVLLHGLNLILLMVFGIASLYILKFDLKEVWKKFRKEKQVTNKSVK